MKLVAPVKKRDPAHTQSLPEILCTIRDPRLLNNPTIPSGFIFNQP